MKGYVLASAFNCEYYTGKTYILDGEIFPCTCMKRCYKEEAKIYTSKKRAENALTKLMNKVDQEFFVLELEE